MEKAKEKLRSAETLLKNDEYDDAVSRAYYCVFHAAQAILLTEGLSADTHQGVVNLFGLHFVKTGKFERRFGKMLANLKDDRENGDYEIYSAIDQESADQAVQEAREFLKEAERYLAGYGV
jgi:uncharacterized protein (UPF0332 family)